MTIAYLMSKTDGALPWYLETFKGSEGGEGTLPNGVSTENNACLLGKMKRS